MNVQDASLDDIAILAIHHRKMFKEIWEQKGLRIETAIAKELESAYIDEISAMYPRVLIRHIT